MAKVLGFTIEINGTQRAVSTSEEIRRAISDIGKELKKATDVQVIQKLEKELIDLKARQAEVNNEVRESVKARQAELIATDKASGAYNKLSKELNEARKRYKDLAAAEQENSEEAKELLKRITLLDNKLKDVDASVGQFQRNVGNYSGAISELFPALGGISNGINQVKTATSGAGKAVGGLLVAFEAFGLVSGLVQDLNANLEETRRISAAIQTFTGQTGDALATSAATVKAIAATYKQDVNEIAVAANTLSRELGVDFAESLNLIEAGFRKGADAQGEFLDSLREYPAQFRDAGASAEQFLAISIAAANEGIYSDKGLDAVKEFGLRIREQTKATSDALRNALGDEFTNKLFADLNKGSISTVDALGKVTRELKSVGVQGAELQTVIADVFGGPGEDVGQRFLFTLGDILDTTEDVTASVTEYQTQLGELFQANMDLENAQKGYNEALADFSFELQVATTKGKTFLANVLKELLNFGNQLPATFAGIKAGFRGLFERPPTLNPIRAVKDFFTDYNKAFKTEVRKIKNEDELQKAAVESLSKSTPETQRRVTQSTRDFGKKVAEELVKGSVAEIENRKGNLDKAFERAVAGSDAQRAIAANLEAVNKELEAAIEKQNRILFEAERKATAEQLKGLVQLTTLAVPQSLEGISGIAETVIKDIKKTAVVANKEIENTSEEAKLSFEDVASASEQIFNAAIDVISAFQQARAEKEQEAFDAQIEQIDANIAALEEKQQNVGRIRAKQIQREIDAAKRQREQAEKQAEEAQKKAAKREKTLAIIQATVQTALGVARALGSAPPPINFINAGVTAVLGAAQIATIAAQPLATGGVITGRRVTDAQNIPTTAQGDNVLAVVRRGEVVLNERQQSALGGSSTFRAIGVPGFNNGGVIGAPPISAPVTSTVASAADYIGALDRKTDAINQRIDRLRAYVVSEDVRADLSEGDRLKLEATL